MGYVQSSGFGNGSVSPVVSSPFPQATTSGNTVVVTVADDLNRVDAVSLSDAFGNAYYRVLGLTSASAWPTTLTMWYATNITGGSGHTVTATFAPYRPAPTPDRCRFVAQEFTGIVTLDRVASRTDTGALARSGATEPTTQDHELVVGGIAVDSVPGNTIGIGEGYSKMAYAATTGSAFAQQHRETETSGPQETTFPLTPDYQGWACGVVAFATPATPQPGAFFNFL